jgi:hypothetical protein
MALLGNYMAGAFATASDGHGGTPMTDAPLSQQLHLTRPHA